MLPLSARKQGHSFVEGAHAALDEHRRLGAEPSGQVDIFDIVEQARIWLMFQPLKDLYGAYQRVEGGAGIIVNAKHPPSLQRFTAAHEYGHHVLGHDLSLDDATHILLEGDDLSARETAAHAFAAHFLMPPRLVDAIWARMLLPDDPDLLTPRDAYLLSLELGVSYAALVNHLATLGKISPEAAARLRRRRPLQIKAEIAGGTRPSHRRADTWLLTERDNGRVLYPRVNDEVCATLPEIPSTGYVWAVAGPEAVDLRHSEQQSADAAVLGLVADLYAPSVAERGSPRYGAGGTRSLVFRVLQPGRYTLRLVKRRPWLDTPVAGVEVTLAVAGRRTGTSTRGLSERQKPLVAAA